MEKVRNRIDAEMNLLRPVGPQGLFSEDWSKNTINDNRFFRCDGDYSNASGKYSEGECKNICESLFGKGEEKTLRNSCKSTCEAKCSWTKCEGGFRPTRASVCTERGLNADCSVKEAITTESVTKSPDKIAAEAMASSQAAQKSKGSAKGSNTTKIVVGVVLLLAVVGTIIYIKRKK